MQRRSTGIRNLDFKTYKQLPIPLPPLAEQKRIVSILDEAFGAIAKAKENAERNLANAKELKQSILQKAFTGHLANHSGAGMSAWPERTLSELCTIRPAKRESKERLGISDAVSFVPMKDLPIDQKYLTAAKEKTLEQVYSGYTYFADGDVLLAKITPCFQNGKLAIAGNLVNGVGFGSSEFIVFRPLEGLDSEFLYYYLSRKLFLDEGVAQMSGAVGHQRVPKEFIEQYLTPLPALSEQKRITSILDEAFGAIAKVNENAEQKLADLDELKQSILQKAFTGQLTSKSSELQSI